MTTIRLTLVVHGPKMQTAVNKEISVSGCEAVPMDSLVQPLASAACTDLVAAGAWPKGHGKVVSK
ncbi:hypothetical protein [Nitrospira sp. Nam74]